MKLQKDLKEFITLLNSKGVDYLVVGAYALAYHGHPRYTGDMDIFVRVSEENASKLEEVVRDFGFSSTGLSAKDFLEEHQVIQLGVVPNRIDILTALTGVTFDEAWWDKVQVELDGVSLNMIGRTHFIKNKRALGRAKDLADIEAIGG